MAQPSDILTDYISPGDVLGERYEVEHEIDAGSYGAIYLALDRESRESVAVKALPPRGEGSSEKAIGRFERELKVVTNLEHPCIVDVVDYGRTDASVVYMVMEYIEGRTLDEEIAAEGALAVDGALSVGKQIAAALSVAHASGVIHRDLKPANIMLVEGAVGHEVKILDFGMAKLFAELGGESIVALTRDGVAVGTPRYIAPEQARGSDRIGPWTDLYALGLLMYEMVIGRKAVPYDEVDRAVAAHVDSDPLDLPGLDDMPDPVRVLIRDLTTKPLEDRVDSAEDVVRRIDAMDAQQFAAEMESDEVVLGRPDFEESDFEPPSAGGTRPIYGSVGRAPDAPETHERSDLDELTEVADDSLELDWDRHREGETPKDLRTDTELPGVVSRLSRTVRLALGGAVVVATTLAAFLVLSAQFHDFTGFRRAMFGLVPLVLALLSVLGSPKPLRGWHLCRNAAAFNAIGFGIAHLVGPSRLVYGLSQEPAWFLEPVRTEPVGASLHRAFAWLGHTYAELLVGLFGVVPPG